jgi:hypothetical protein
MVNVPMVVGAIGETTNVPEMSLDVKFPDASCVTVRTVEPAPTIVTKPSNETVAALRSLLLYRNAPLLSVLGIPRLNAASRKFLAEGMVNGPKVGAIGETANVPEMSLAVKFPHASCVTVRTVDPAPTIVTKPFGETVAALRLLLLYRNTPLLSVLGVPRLNDASRKFLAEGMVNAPKVGATLFTVKLAVFDPAPKSNEESCIAVTVAGLPASVAEEIVTTRWFVGTLTFTYEMVPGKYSPA